MIYEEIERVKNQISSVQQQFRIPVMKAATNETHVVGLFWLVENRLGGYAYAVSETRAQWSDARDLCEQDEATLAVIDSSIKHSFLSERFASSSNA